MKAIFGPKRAGNVNRKRLHNEKLYSSYRSPNVVRVIKSLRLRWAGHLTRMIEHRNALKILTNKPTERRPLRKAHM